ncbi:10410_t:CDS:1, partial [Racocetra persica]
TLAKLEAIINQTNQPKPTGETPQPERPKPNSPVDKPENPIVENNRESQENIEELSHLPLAEAKIKAKKEIETLFDRYGVQASQLDTGL